MKETGKFLLKHPYLTSSALTGIFMATNFAIKWAPTNEIASTYTIPIGLLVFAGMYLLEKASINLAQHVFSARNETVHNESPPDFDESSKKLLKLLNKKKPPFLIIPGLSSGKFYDTLQTSAEEFGIHLSTSYKFGFSTNPEEGKFDESYFNEFEKFIAEKCKAHKSKRVVVVEDWASTHTKAKNMSLVIKKLGLKPDIIILTSEGNDPNYTIISPNNPKLVEEIRNKFTKHARIYVTDFTQR